MTVRFKNSTIIKTARNFTDAGKKVSRGGEAKSKEKNIEMNQKARKKTGLDNNQRKTYRCSKKFRRWWPAVGRNVKEVDAARRY